MGIFGKMHLTDLRLDPIGVPPYSARGISQRLTLIDAGAQLRRDINGTLRDLSDAAFRKFASTITCTDQQQPALDGVWFGRELTVDCVAELSYLTAGGAPARPLAETTDDPATRTEGLFTFYRPRLVMRVVGWTTEFAEWAADVNWTLDLEEV